MIRAVLAAFWSHWRRNPVQLVTLVAGIALATALWTGVQGINAEARTRLDDAARIAGTADLSRLERVDGGTIPMADFVALRRAGVLVSPLIEEQAEIAPGIWLNLTGTDPLTAPTGLWPAPEFTGPPGNPDAVFVPPDTPRADGLVPQESLPAGTAIADIGTALRLLDRDDLDALILTPPQPLGAPDPLSVIPGLELVAPTASTDPAALTESFRLNLTAFGALCFIVGMFIIRGTIGLALAQRNRTLVVLRALGVPQRLMAALMLAELAMIAALAGLAGVMLGYLLATALLPGVSATLSGIYGAEIGNEVAIRPVWWLGGLSIAILGTLLSATGPLIRAADQPVLSTQPHLPLNWLMLGGTTLLLAAIGVVWLGDGLAAGFGAIGLLLLGAAALMPVCLAGLLQLLRHVSRGPVAGWTLAETRAQIPQMSLAMTALMMALAANIGIGTMVDSFRQSFTDFINQRLAAELYVATPDGGDDLRRALPDGDRALPLRWADAKVAGQNTEIYGVVDDVTYRRDWPLLSGGPDAWEAVQQGDAAIINEQLYYRADIGLGDTLTLPDGKAKVAGIIADYGNPFAKVYVSDERLSRIAPEATAARYAIRTDDAQATREALIAAGIAPDRIGLQSELKQASLRIFERTFAVTAVLNTLTLAVAAFAVLTSMLTMADERLPRLAPLWAMGLARDQLALLELGRVALTAALTCLLALPVGIALSWLLLAVVNVEAFGWRLPFRAAPVQWLFVLGLGCAAAILAATWPVWRLARMSPRALTEIFANDQ